MVGALRLQFTSSAPMNAMGNGVLNYEPRLNLLHFNRNRRVFTALSVRQSPSSDSSVLTSTVGFTSSSPIHLSQLNFSHRHIQVLSFVACAAAVSATWLFCSAIPTLLAFKRAAESLEKLMNVTREEIPGTMAAIRLSGMEISDLTMELSDLGQEITQGVKKSTRVVRVAEERLRKLTNMNPTAPMQEIVEEVNRTRQPVVARTARVVKQAIISGRAFFQMLFTFTRFSTIVLNYLRTRTQAKA